MGSFEININRKKENFKKKGKSDRKATRNQPNFRLKSTDEKPITQKKQRRE